MEKINKIAWIDEQINLRQQKIKDLEIQIQTYESVKKDLISRNSQLIEAENNKKLMASDIVSMFPEVLSKKRYRDIAYKKIIVSMELLNLGLTVVEVGNIMDVDHSTIVHRRQKYNDLMHVKDKLLLHLLNEFNQKVGREYIQTSQKSIEFYKHWSKAYAKHQKFRYMQIALANVVITEIGVDSLIMSALGKSYSFVRSMKYEYDLLKDDHVFKKVDNKIKLEYEKFEI